MYAKAVIETSLSNSERTINGINGMSTVNTLSKAKNYQQKWLEKMDFLQSISIHDNAVISLFDTSTYQYIYLCDKTNVLGGYDSSLFTTENGTDFFFSNMHPEQRAAAILIQLKVLSYGIEHTGAILNNVVANTTFLFRKKNGEYFQYLQKGIVVETDELGSPLLYLRYGYDVSHLVKPSVGLIINSPERTLIWNYNAKTKALEQINLLSVQEKKILKFLSEGKESKEIADLLFISPHTIDTHRRNLLKKTFCIDTTALITFAKMTGLI